MKILKSILLTPFYIIGNIALIILILFDSVSVKKNIEEVFTREARCTNCGHTGKPFFEEK